jgi:hypothetical protein
LAELSSEPAGSSRFWEFRAFSTSSTETPRAAISFASSQIRMA